MRGQSLIEKGEIGVDQIADRKVRLDQVRDIRLGFQRQVVVEQFVEQRIQLERGRDFIEGTQVQPLPAEGTDHPATLGIRQHA